MAAQTIFLADDDADDREFFETACDKIDTQIQLQLFKNGQLLFEYLKVGEIIPDIVFLDINMPKMDGFQCLDQIRNTLSLRNLCVIMYSTSNNKADINKCYSLKANGFVQKPYSFNELKSILEKIFVTDWEDPCSKLDELNFILRPEYPERKQS